jgi:serine/threonine protein phosphatase 1
VANVLDRLGDRIGLKPRRRAGDTAAADGQLVYAVGDVHGCYGLLKRLLARIAADYLDRARGRRPILVFLGDYVDRGPQPAEVLETLLWLQRKGPFELHLLKGNHEQALLEFLDAPADAGPWLSYGGAETLAGYGVAPPAADAGEGAFVRARDELLARLPAAHLRLLQTLSLMVTVGDYAFVHAGVRPGTALAEQDEDDLLWIREDFIQAPGPFEKIIVHGHSWASERPQVLGHRIGIDTGAYATGVLSAVRIEDGAIGVLQTDTKGEVPWNPWTIPEPPGAPGAEPAGPTEGR